MKSIFNLLCILVLFFLFSSLFNAYGYRKVLLAAVPKYFPPQYYTNNKGEPYGFAIDIMNHIAKLCGYNVRYIIKDNWDQVQASLKSGEADLIPDLGITEKRMNDFYFSIPIETFDITIFVRKSMHHINSFNDLSGHRVVAVKTNAAVDILQKNPKIELVIKDSISDALFELVSGDSDALLYPRESALKVAQKIGIDNKITVVGETVTEVKRALAFRKDSIDLVEQFNEIIEKFIISTEYQRIYVKWYGYSNAIFILKVIIITLVIISLILIITMFSWRYFSIIKINKELLENIEKGKILESNLQQSNKRLEILHQIDKEITLIKPPEEIIKYALKRLKTLIPCWRISTILFDSSDNTFTYYVLNNYENWKKIKNQHFKIIRDAIYKKIESGRIADIPDIDLIEKTTSFRIEQIRKEGAKSLLIAPLLLKKKLVGVIKLSSKEKNFFTPIHKEIIVEISSEIVIAIEQHYLYTQIENQNIMLEKKIKERTIQLEESNKELESFSYSVSHDLRAPLRSINGFSSILLSDYADKLENGAKKYLSNISKSAGKMRQLIDDLLEFSRTNRRDIIRKTIDTKSLISDVFNDLSQLNGNKNRDISLVLSNILNFNADEAMIKQVFVNLLSNAIKFTKNNVKSIIEINSTKDDDYITYFIKDNGVGFDEEYKDKLFGVFQRLHSINDFEGTGIGLALVYRIIAKHGGKVWAEGKINEGATFYFSIPTS